MSELSYRPLTMRQFRLLTLLPGAEATPIQTTLRHVNLEEKTTFDALSYEWSSESTNNSEIFVDKELFTIRHNLWLFLKRLRAFSQSAQVIYADAICINQRDGEEKGRQVALMSEIYMRAKRVLVWLGEHDRNSELVFGTHFEDAVSKIPRGVMMIPFVPLLAIPVVVAGRVRRATQASRADRVAAWMALLSWSYWNWTWIVQEFLLSRSVIVFCGPDHMDRDLIFTRPLQDHFMHIFELAFNFQYTECQVMLDHVYGLLALEDLRKSPPITPSYSISTQMLFIDICMLKLPRATGSGSEVTEDGMWRVPKLFRGLRLTFDHAEEILDVLFDNNQYKTQKSIVIATIAKAFDQFGLIKPERKQWILPQTKASQTAEQIISVTRQWRKTQKEIGNWYDIHRTAQIHEPPGMVFLQLDEPLWSHYSTLRDTATRNAQNMNNINQNNTNQNTMNLMVMKNMNNMAMMGPGGGGGA